MVLNNTKNSYFLILKELNFIKINKMSCFENCEDQSNEIRIEKKKNSEKKFNESSIKKNQQYKTQVEDMKKDEIGDKNKEQEESEEQDTDKEKNQKRGKRNEITTKISDVKNIGQKKREKELINKRE